MESNIGILVGKTLKEVKISDDKDVVTFVCEDGTKYQMYHDQDCCEGVSVEDVVGNLDDLIGSPILRASEDTNNETNPEGITKEYQDGSFTWTFYNLETVKGHVTIRWYGESNGYYSESVEFEEVRIN